MNFQIDRCLELVPVAWLVKPLRFLGIDSVVGVINNCSIIYVVFMYIKIYIKIVIFKKRKMIKKGRIRL